jgi:hypothetical protein
MKLTTFMRHSSDLVYIGFTMTPDASADSRFTRHNSIQW